MKIHEAARCGDHSAIAAALRAGADINAQDNWWDTPLLAALRSARNDTYCGRKMKVTLETIRLLLDSGADLNKADNQGEYPIHAAAQIPDVAFLDELLRRGADPNAATTRKLSPLLFACSQRASQGKLEILDSLHRAGANLDLVVDRSLVCKMCDVHPLDSCLWADDFAAFRHLARLGADQTRLHFSPLQQAVSFGELADVCTLNFTSAEINAKAPGSDWSAWLLAVARGEVAIIEWLAEKGADLTQIERCGHTALHVAARFGNAEALTWLLDLGFNPDQTDDFLCTALYDAARENQLACARVLIKRGANASFLNHTKGQPIHEANSLEMVQLLVEMGGADINAISGAGEWPLREAAGRGDLDCMRWLLARGAKVDHTSTGETALMEAVNFDELEAVTLLLEHGADPNATDVDGWPVYYFASSAEAIHLLLRKGMRINREDFTHRFAGTDLSNALDDIPDSDRP